MQSHSVHTHIAAHIHHTYTYTFVTGCDIITVFFFFVSCLGCCHHRYVRVFEVRYEYIITYLKQKKQYHESCINFSFCYLILFRFFNGAREKKTPSSHHLFVIVLIASAGGALSMYLN